MDGLDERAADVDERVAFMGVLGADRIELVDELEYMKDVGSDRLGLVYSESRCRRSEEPSV